MLPLVAGTTREQLTANIDAVEIALTPEQMARLDAAGE